MRKTRFSEEQIIGILKEAAVGSAVKDLCRRPQMPVGLGCYRPN